MSTALLAHTREAGLTLRYEPPDTIIVRGPPEVRARWLPTLRRHKPTLLAALKAQPAANDEPTRLSIEDDARIRSWLQAIGEEDPGTVDEVLERARTDPEARAYYLRRAGEAAVPAYYERVLGNAPKSIATLEPVQRKEAARLGLLPREIAEGDMVVLAFRRDGAQGLLTIPADRYDGFEVLRIFDPEGLGA